MIPIHSAHNRPVGSNVGNLGGQAVEVGLHLVVLLGHLFVLGLPVVALNLEGLDFALEVSGLDVSLAEPAWKSALATAM